MRKVSRFAWVLLVISLFFSGCSVLLEESNTLSTQSQVVSDISSESETTEIEQIDSTETNENYSIPIEIEPISLSSIPAYSDAPYIVINNNEPYFNENDYTTQSYEYYSELDELGRCGVVIACIGKELMPTEERGKIGEVKPTGWHTVKYDCVDGNYLYNRCHLIGFQLSGENANTRNLITGTRYMNVEGMLPFENMVADFVKETDYHVLYRVTPIYEGNNLLANGVQMEAYSVEDKGDGICFHVFVYNVQPQIEIDYATGESSYIGAVSDVVEEEPPAVIEQPVVEEPPVVNEPSVSYILNTNTKKFHYPDCASVKRMKESNKEYFTGSRDDVIFRGYDPCGNCHP